MWSICGSFLTSASVPLGSTFDLTSEHDSKRNKVFFPHLDFHAMFLKSESRRYDENLDIECCLQWSWCLEREVVVVYPPHTSHSFLMRGQRGCCACCEWPQGKVSQLGWNAGTEALCRPGSSRALGAVMSAGGRNKDWKTTWDRESIQKKHSSNPSCTAEACWHGV